MSIGISSSCRTSATVEVNLSRGSMGQWLSGLQVVTVIIDRYGLDGYLLRADVTELADYRRPAVPA